MTMPLPKVIVLLDDRRFKVRTVHYQMSRDTWRVSWEDERPKGGIATIDGDAFREVERSAPVAAQADGDPVTAEAV